MTSESTGAIYLPGRIAVIGAGAFGRYCIDAYRRSGDLRILAVADPDARARALVDSPGTQVVDRWQDAIAIDGVEVVHVATPPFLRAPVIDAAFAAGKSVFCEKPLALTLAEADEMIRAAEQAGVALGVNYVMRHLPAYRLLERFASSEIFGSLRTISFQNFAQRVPHGHWFWDHRKSGGILVEHGVHFFDAYAQIAGDGEAVWCRAPRPDTIDASINYQTGVIGRFYHEFAFPAAVELSTGTSMFERGSVEIDGWIPTRLSGAVQAPAETLRELAASPEFTAAEDRGVTRFELNFHDREAHYQAAIVSGLRDAVKRHRDPQHVMTVSPLDARRSLAVALAAQRLADDQTRAVHV